ncbi:hypothetical protein SAMN05216388_1001405 [Halorientalis persicus]|jgi:hypothetical protein|uniref:Uncharacterized protein n=1 Tax=Halorientalis persicus TaxID=1367881 RepID=A0A1H8DYW7_9EURY|nr:hypothetical protein [Halorientalis persicus]SEN11727.1 hypothetical protein SAMN05216388_1001405 [Halorientalis persicus]
MARAPVDDADAERDAPVAAGQYVELDAAEGVVIYDRENHCAWLQSDGAVSVTDRR